MKKKSQVSVPLNLPKDYSIVSSNNPSLKKKRENKCRAAPTKILRFKVILNPVTLFKVKKSGLKYHLPCLFFLFDIRLQPVKERIYNSSFCLIGPQLQPVDQFFHYPL